MGLHEQVNIPKLLVLGGLCRDLPHAVSSLSHGAVYVEQWNISVAESTLPRWVLRGVAIRVGEHSIRISEDGLKILATRDLQLA